MKEYYSPRFLADGGPVIDGPKVAEASDAWTDMAAVAIVVLHSGQTPEGYRFGIIDPAGNVVAAANRSAELIGYLDLYAEALDEVVGSFS